MLRPYTEGILTLYNVILLPLDGSPLSERALPDATAIARRFGAKLALFAVVESHDVYSQPGVVAPIVGDQSKTDEEVAEVRTYLLGFADKLRDEGLDVIVEVRRGDPATEICDYARKISADLIVMSTHGRSGIRRWVYGSVADRILRSASVPVLLVRALTDEESQ